MNYNIEKWEYIVDTPKGRGVILNIREEPITRKCFATVELFENRGLYEFDENQVWRVECIPKSKNLYRGSVENETGEIHEEDIARFHTIVKSLNKLVEKIRKYCPSAHLYVTPSHINLMTGYGSCVGNGPLEKHGDEQVVEQETVLHMDCGDW